MIGRAVRCLAWGLSLATLLAAAMAASVQARGGVTDDEVVLGATTPLSGPAAAWGATARAVEAYAEYINEQGGIHGRKIRVVLRDDGYLPPRAMANVREFIDRIGVFGLVGPLGSANVAATRDFIISKRVFFTPIADSGLWADYGDLTYVIDVYPYYRYEAMVLARYAVQQLGARRVAIIYQNDQYGRPGLEGASAALAEMGMRLVAQVPYELTETDLSLHALRVQEAQADAVLLYATPRHGALAAQALHRLNPRPRILSTFTLADPVMAQLAGEAWNGVIVPAYFPFPEMDPKVQRVLDIVVARKPELKATPFNALAGITFLEPFLEGFRRAGRNLTPETFRAAIESIQNWDGELLRNVTFGPNRRQGINAIFLSRMEGGRPVRISDWLTYPVDH